MICFMLFAKSPPLNILTCKTCNNTGFVGFRKCPECRGMILGRAVEEHFLYFGYPLSPYFVALRRARRMLNSFRLIGALVFGFGFLAFFVLLAYSRGLVDELLTATFWTRGNVIQVLFWLSLGSFSYLWYRLIVRATPEEAMRYTERFGEAKAAKELLDVPTWEHAKKLSGRKKKDASGVFSPDALAAIDAGYQHAAAQKAKEFTPMHLFASLLKNDAIASVFVRLGISSKLIEARLEKIASVEQSNADPLLSDDFRQMMFQAYDSARRARDDQVFVTELLEASVNQSELLQELLYDLNVDKQKLAHVIEWARIRERLRRQYVKLRAAGARRSKHGIDRAMTAVATPYLNSFSQDLTIAAKYGYLAPCVARDKEIDEIFRIIEGGRQSVLMVGERGVGKMTMIEGIAQRMVEENVPKRLKDKRLVLLSTSSLLAGATVSGAEERLIRIMKEVSRAGNIILAINNLHDLVGMPEAGEGLDVSEALAEHLGPGKFLTLATTTPEGYKQFIANTQVGKVFARVDIAEMDKNQAIQALESKVGSLEYKHRVFFSYDALEKSVALADRFLQEDRLPESAIEVATEAASLVRTKKGERQLVTGDDAAEVISSKTGIPAVSVSEDESEKLLRLEQVMHERMIGQDEAVSLVANALRRARVEIRSKNRPIANFLFLGPTGVGKTELAKTIASVYFGGEERMIRFDMSEFQEPGTSVSRLIGAPGQKGTGLLTEAVRTKPFSLILLDEMEKADANALNLFLQVFDDGRLADSIGRVIDFTNTIIIATSNAGTPYIQGELRKGVALATIREAMVRGELQKQFRPEFLNRFDGIVLFRPLDKNEIKQIAKLMLKRVAKDLEERGVELRVEDAALDALAEVGFDPEFGARPMRRAIQDRVENKLAELILSGSLKRRDVVVLGKGGEMRVERSS